jgi:hypothetical protein
VIPSMPAQKLHCTRVWSQDPTARCGAVLLTTQAASHSLRSAFPLILRTCELGRSPGALSRQLRVRRRGAAQRQPCRHETCPARRTPWLAMPTQSLQTPFNGRRVWGPQRAGLPIVARRVDSRAYSRGPCRRTVGTCFRRAQIGIGVSGNAMGSVPRSGLVGLSSRTQL